MKLHAVFLWPHHLMNPLTWKNLLILLFLIFPSLLTQLTCLTSCWTASVATLALSMMQLLMIKMTLQLQKCCVKMNCISFSLEMSSRWKCRTLKWKPSTVLFLGGNHQPTDSRIFRGLLSTILQFLLHPPHLSTSGAKLQDSSLSDEIVCRRRLLQL